VRGIVTESSQEAMEQSVCDALTASELYHSAWIGDVEDDRPVLSVRCSAGDDEVLDTLTDAAREFGYSEEIVDMIRAGDSFAVSDLPTNEDIPEQIRRLAAAHDVGSFIIVPLAFGETLYGTLVVNTSSVDAFDDREQSAFEVLGVIVGFAINALRNRHLLFSDAIVELEFQTADREAFFSGVTREYDCRCVLEGQVLTEDERTLQYVRVSGLPHEQIYDLASEHDTLEEVRLVSGDGDECLLEVVNTDSGVQALVEAGAYVQSGVAENGIATIRAEVAKGEDIRGVVKAFRRVYPDATLVSKREHDRPARTAQTFRHELEQRLTKRQQTALRTAHLAGYFDWPRGSTAEEVAAAMDITSATLHYHLRRAQRELIDAYLDGEST
jgi:predicted DNA binding protein